MSGTRAYFSGLAAEDIAQRHYLAMGAQVLARRWRCEAGEIDLIVEHSGTTVFVEVKARRTHTSAANALSARQWRRVAAAAQVYMSEMGRAGDMRIDVALIDRLGAIDVIENAVLWE